jgi:hypothetical protein
MPGLFSIYSKINGLINAQATNSSKVNVIRVLKSESLNAVRQANAFVVMEGVRLV